MSLVKRRIDEDLERGFFSFGAFVCDLCIADEFVKEFVVDNAEEPECDYCGRTDERAIAAAVDEVIELIVDGLKYEFADPVEELFYDGREGGYQGEVHDIRDLLAGIDDPIEGDNFREAFIEQLTETAWCKRDYAAPFQDEALVYDWEQFVERVKFDSRFFFLLQHEDPIDLEPGQAPTILVLLHRIAELAEQTGLFRWLEPGTEQWRARSHEEGVAYTRSADLGTAPATIAVQSNRMSPAGIPAFYGGGDLNTAVFELEGSADLAKPCWSAGLFVTNHHALVLDLTDLPAPPSLFDADRRHLRRPLFFLSHFATEISKPVEKDGREHIDYVPTQVVAEFLRVAFKPDGGHAVAGILYPSAQQVGGICSVLFVPHERCLDSAPNGDRLSLVLQRTEHSP